MCLGYELSHSSPLNTCVMSIKWSSTTTARWYVGSPLCFNSTGSGSGVYISTSSRLSGLSGLSVSVCIDIFVSLSDRLSWSCVLGLLGLLGLEWLNSTSPRRRSYTYCERLLKRVIRVIRVIRALGGRGLIIRAILYLS